MEHCKRTQKTEMCIYTNIYTNIMCHLQSYSVYNNQPATWVQLITVFFKIKHKKVNPGVFPWVSKLFPNNPEVSTAQRIEKKNKRLLEAFLRGRWGHWDLSGFLRRGWKGVGDVGLQQEIWETQNSKFPPKVEFEVWGFWVKTFGGCLIIFDFLEMFEKCFDDGLRCLNMVNDT